MSSVDAGQPVATALSAPTKAAIAPAISPMDPALPNRSASPVIDTAAKMVPADGDDDKAATPQAITSPHRPLEPFPMAQESNSAVFENPEANSSQLSAIAELPPSILGSPGPSTGEAQELETNHNIECQCNPKRPAARFQVKKAGRNKGRWFFTCVLSQGCKFFLWEEDLAKMTSTPINVVKKASSPAPEETSPPASQETIHISTSSIATPEPSRSTSAPMPVTYHPVPLSMLPLHLLPPGFPIPPLDTIINVPYPLPADWPLPPLPMPTMPTTMPYPYMGAYMPMHGYMPPMPMPMPMPMYAPAPMPMPTLGQPQLLPATQTQTKPTALLTSTATQPSPSVNTTPPATTEAEVSNEASSSSGTKRAHDSEPDTAEAENKPPRTCKCNLEMRIYTTKKEGPNKGRKFWKCTLATKGCKLFEWDDEPTWNAPDIPAPATGKRAKKATTTKAPKKTSTRTSRSQSGACLRCGRQGHWVSECYSRGYSGFGRRYY